MAAVSPIKFWSASFANAKIVNTVITLVTAIRVTESATSPLARNVIIFEDTPPEHSATMINPIAIAGCMGTTFAITKPIIGKITN